MYQLWQYVKPFFKPFFATEERFSLAKERALLVLGFLFRRPIIYRHQLPVLLEYLHRRGRGVEIGVRDGSYSETILHYSRLSKLHSVDPWKEYRREDYHDASNVSQDRQDWLWAFAGKRLAIFSPRSEILRLTSKEAAKLFADASLDFVYIDANHSYGGVKEDISLWWPKVKTGGVLAGHDYIKEIFGSPDQFGVKRAVDEFVKTHQQKMYATPEKWPTWYLIKNSSLPRPVAFLGYLWKEITAQYQDIALWRQTRGIR